jgi:4-diphosphocytidyl-2-C-methyl-D-erythritol kinase
LKTLTLPAPAKLNLFLHITGLRADGLHNLQTVFQLLDLCDLLHFRLRDDGQIHIHCPALPHLAPEHSTVYRAACLLPRAAHQGIDVVVEKNIPAGAGLGGGSSDAATTLMALNHLWQLHLDQSTLLSLGRQIGADVPVFIGGHTAWAEGIGEQLTQLDLAPTCYLLIFPNCHVSTAEIFSAQQLTRQTPAITLADFHLGNTHNDCTAVTCERYPEVDAALQWLKQFGEAKMSGTGSSCFVALDRPLAEQAQQQLHGRWQIFIVNGVNRSPLHEALYSVLNS